MLVIGYLGVLVFFGMLIPTAWAEVVIQNDQHYVGDDDSLHIVGEIQNNLQVPISQVQVHVTLYDVNGHVIDTKETESLANMIMPNMKAPFDLILGGHEARTVSSYSVDVNYKTSQPKNQVIDVVSSELVIDNLKNTIVRGTIANNGEITANTVSVIATFYDNNGNVVAVSKMHTEPDYLRVNDKAHFLMAVPDKKQSESIVHYTLVAESEEYTAVPEFPIGSLLLLGGSVAGYIMLTRYSNRFITNLISATNPK